MKYICYLGIIALLFSCNYSEKPSKPKNLIPEDKIVAIIVDIALLNSAKGTNKAVLENNNVNTENYIYRKHNIDSAQFAKSNDYYAYNLKKYTAIYKKVEDSLDKLKAFYKEKSEQELKEKREKDTVPVPDKLLKKRKPQKAKDSVKPLLAPEIF